VRSRRRGDVDDSACAKAGARFASGHFARLLKKEEGAAVILRIACAIPVSLVLSATSAAADVVDFAARLIGRPYVWGAEGPHSFDCSGLTQYVYQEFGIELPRRAISQSRVGDRSGAGLRRGDLLFFSTDTRRSLVTHVGIYEGGGIMIDASKRHGRVRRDNLRDDYWADRFMFARRVSGLRADNRSPRTESRPDRRRTAIRVLETLADVLIRRPRR
jgi:cell wall-associated NlpC family hydrolase